MQNALPRSTPTPVPSAHAEVLSRLACVRHALRLVDPYGGGPAPDPEIDDAIAAAWDSADEAKRRRFDVRSGLLVGATVAGIGALMNERAEGNEPNAEASTALVEQIRRELRDVARVILD
jgi:ferric-dicitrate binding protein FerR (iron transport regulator)